MNENPLTVSVGATALATYEYTADAQRDLSTITYANGNSFVITKDVLGNGINADLYCFLDENEETSSGWYAFYDDFGALYMLLLDDANGRYILFRDGLTEECMPGEEILDPPVVLHSYAANEIADGTQLLEKIGSTTVKSTYLNDTQGNASLAQFSIVGSSGAPVNQEKRWDEYGRLAETGVYSGEIGDTRENAAVVTGYGYTGDPGAKTSSQVASVSISGGEGAGAFYSSYEYWYDAVGNISDIYKDNALSAHYEYDEAGQLIRADDAQQNQSFTYNYDAGGNLLTKKEYAFTTGTLGTATDTIQYTYGDSNWDDKLTAFDGNAVSYDASGNPTAYDGWTYTWEGSGRLTGMSKTGIGNIAFTYNQDGIRTGKTVGSVTTEYTVVDSKITHMQTGSDNLYFFYDENDSLVSLNVDGDDYFYVKNLQGDIIALTDVDGNIVVEYLYDAWGRLLSTTGSMAGTLGAANPFRYRGYFYDSETGLYYLQSRYYSPEWGRFVNADRFCDTNAGIVGTNMFTYCNNDTINYLDQSGTFSKKYHRETTMRMVKDIFKEKYAIIMADNNVSIDEKYSALKLTEKNQSWHFNTNSLNPNAEDSRDVHTRERIMKAYYYLDLASKTKNLKKKYANLEEAFKCFGQGLHCQQDLIAHNENIVHGSSRTVYWHWFNREDESMPYLDTGFTIGEVGDRVTQVYIICIYIKLKHDYPDLLKLCLK